MGVALSAPQAGTYIFRSLYLRFPSLRTGTCVFHTYIFHPCKFILTFPVLAFSILFRTISYFPFPYLRFSAPPFSFEPCHFRWPWATLEGHFSYTGHLSRPNVSKTYSIYHLYETIGPTTIAEYCFYC